MQAPVTLAEAAPRLTTWLEDAFRQLNLPLVDFTRREYRPPSMDEKTPYNVKALLAGDAGIREVIHADFTALYRTLPASVSRADYPALRAQLLDRRRQFELAEE